MRDSSVYFRYIARDGDFKDYWEFSGGIMEEG